MNRIAAIILHLLVGLVVLDGSVWAQGVDREKLRMAQTFERTGDMRGAARIYQELHATDPRNDAYFQGVVRSLSALQQYAALLPLVEQQATRAPSLQTFILAGTLNSRVGNMAKAETWWAEAMKQADDRENAYVMIGQEQMQLNLHAQALASYRSARALNSNSTAYAEEIARLCALTGDIAASAREVVALYGAEGDIIQAQRQLSILLASDGGANAIAVELARLPDTYADVLRLKQWFYRQTKNWKAALGITEKLDEQSRQRGQELLLFADGARSDDQYDVAVEAYAIVLREVKDERMRMSAAYGSARALDQKLRSARTIGPDEARTLVERYDEIIERYGQHPIAADALYHAAVLEDEVLQNTDRARDRLMRLLNTWRGTTTWIDAALRLADIYLAMRRDAEAVNVLRMVLATPQNVATDRRDLARLRLGDLHFWEGNLDSARTYFLPLAETPGSLASNDAIDRLLLIDLAQDDSTAVKTIAAAEGMLVRRSYMDAGRTFASAAAATRDAELRDRALYNGALAYVRAGSDSLARPLIEEILPSIPESIFGDRALVLVADILQRRGDVQGALQALDALLVNYPRSILVPNARERIRRLRGDA